MVRWDLPRVPETVELAVREGITITDNQDMTVTVVIGAQEEEALRLALDCGALALPAGVLLIIENTSAQVTGVTALEGDEQVELAWNAPMGANIVGYCIQWKRGNQSYDVSRQTTVAGTETDVTITELTNGTEYTFRVRAEAIVGNGAFSDEVTATPQTLPDQVSGVSATGTETEITLVWDEPDDGGSPITEYWVQWKSGNQGYSAARRLEDITEREVTITGLNSGTEYTFRVRAINLNGIGAWSAEEMATPATAPGQVAPPTTTPGDERVTVGYVAPDNGGIAIDRYRIQWKSPGQVYSAARETTRVGLQAIVLGLANGTEYDFRVRAENDVGNGLWSAEVSETPLGAPGRVPGGIVVPGQRDGGPGSGLARA